MMSWKFAGIFFILFLRFTSLWWRMNARIYGAREVGMDGGAAKEEKLNFLHKTFLFFVDDFSSLGTTSLGLFYFSFAFITRRWRLQVFSYGKKMVFKKSYWNRRFYHYCQTQTQTHKMQVDYCVNVKFFLLEWKLIFFVWRKIFSWLTFIHIH